ncbi:hypothetical protein ABZ354_24275 [Streptomyces sp. NPDC005925]|uniref:hypothetical protein n=1 Tax=Streptomyces sp. NPDC005925 TaxID=3157172 RepID=UPI0034084EC4
MSARKVLAMTAAVAALIVGPALSGSASAEPTATQSEYTRQSLEAGLTGTQAASLQQQVDEYLATHPDARQVSANRLTTEGGSVTLPAPGQSPARDLASPETALACAGGHLCIVDGRGRNYDYYYCGSYGFDGVGDGTFNNNQTTGTVARFYNSDGSLRWSNRAKASGTASWTPVFSIRPC